jgi:hypothetical protein
MSNFENDSCMAVAVGWTYGGVNWIGRGCSHTGLLSSGRTDEATQQCASRTGCTGACGHSVAVRVCACWLADTRTERVAHWSFSCTHTCAQPGVHAEHEYELIHTCVCNFVRTHTDHPPPVSEWCWWWQETCVEIFCVSLFRPSDSQSDELFGWCRGTGVDRRMESEWLIIMKTQTITQCGCWLHSQMYVILAHTHSAAFAAYAACNWQV